MFSRTPLVTPQIHRKRNKDLGVLELVAIALGAWLVVIFGYFQE